MSLSSRKKLSLLLRESTNDTVDILLAQITQLGGV